MWQDKYIPIKSGGEAYQACFYQDEDSMQEMGHAVVGSEGMMVLVDYDARTMLFPRGSTRETVVDCIARGAKMIAEDSTLTIDRKLRRIKEDVIIGTNESGESYL
jgi:hypothetical protein